MAHASAFVLEGGEEWFGMLFATTETQQIVLEGQKPVPCLAFGLDEVADWSALVLHKDLCRSCFLGGGGRGKSSWVRLKNHLG